MAKVRQGVAAKTTRIPMRTSDPAREQSRKERRAEMASQLLKLAEAAMWPGTISLRYEAECTKFHRDQGTASTNDK